MILNKKAAQKKETFVQHAFLEKRKKIPFSKERTEHAARVHSDVSDPVTPRSKGGSGYVVTFVDQGMLLLNL